MRNVVVEPIMLSASVSCFDLFDFKSDYDEVRKSKVSFLHYDVVDGNFNECIILGTTMLESIRPHVDLPIEVHLAAYAPERYIEQFIKAGADYVAVHYEAMENPFETFRMIEKLGAVPILALKSTTEFSKEMLPLCRDIPWVLKLTVNPGFSGQKIQPQAIEHIRSMRRMLSEAGLKTGIQADGNINAKTIPEVVAAGANILTGGTSGLFLPGDSVRNHAEKLLEIARKEVS